MKLAVRKCRGFARRFQPVIATSRTNTSVGVCPTRVWRRRLLNCAAIASNGRGQRFLKFMPLGMDSRNRPLVILRLPVDLVLQSP